MLQRPVYIPAVFLCLYGLSFVELLLTSAQGDIHLGSAMVVNEDESWHYGKARSLGVLEQMPYLALGEKQLAVALGLMVGIAAIEIG